MSSDGEHVGKISEIMLGGPLAGNGGGEMGRVNVQL
jgi:hypothetical protein